MEDIGSTFKVDSSSTSVKADAVRGNATGLDARNQAKLIGTGAISITTSAGMSATGIEVRDGATVEWTGDLTGLSTLHSIKVADADNEAGNLGIFHPDNDGQEPYVPSSITVSGNIDLTSTATGGVENNNVFAYNVVLDTEKNKDETNGLKDKITLGAADKTVKLSASVLSSVAGDEANSLAIENGTVEILGQSVSISASAEGSGSAIGVFMNGGQVDLGSAGGKVDISAKDSSGTAKALDIQAGTLNLNGDTTISSGIISSGIVSPDNEGSLGNGKIVVNGNLNLGSLEIINGNALTINGSVTTTSGCVFTNAASDTQTTIGEILYTGKLDFQKQSKLILTDEQYTLAYLKIFRIRSKMHLPFR